MNIAEKYLVEALDAYPYDIKGAMEALDYVLSYDEENAIAYCLLGEIYAGHMGDYNLAIENFEYALNIDPNTWRVYIPYVSTLMSIEAFDKANKVIDYAMNIKSVDKSMMWCMKALIEEYHLNFKAALAHLKKAKNYALLDFQINYINELKARIKAKKPKSKSKKKAKKKDNSSSGKKAA